MELLEKTRKINKLLHNSSSSKVVFNDICQVLMETLSSNILVLSKKGKVLGVSICPGVDEITELIVTKDMAERKAKMIELGDAFIAFPGGTGTLEEITEVMSMVSLKHLDAPCILYNLNGYYDSLKQLLEHMIEMDLSSREKQEGIYFAENLEKIQKCLAK